MAVLSAIGWFFTQLAMAFYNIAYAITHPVLWLDWITWDNTQEDKQSIMRFVYYGSSQELLFAFFAVVIVIVGIGMFRNAFMWATVRVLEGFANGVGRFFAWAGLIMVLQQIMIVFMQRVFAVSEISFGFGMTVSFPVSWWADELKLFNAMVVTLCLAYTFVQGGHVRVDLIYSAVSHRTKRLIDMFGSIFLMLPAAILTWLYAWFFMWRSTITPPLNATNTYEQLLEQKWRAVRWNVETTGFSGQNGFSLYILFKILLMFMVFMIMVQAVAFFCRSYLEWKEGEDSAGKYLDKDSLGDETAELAAQIH